MSAGRQLVVVELEALEGIVERAVARVLASRSATDTPAEWLDQGEAAALVGVHRDTLGRMRDVPCSRVGRMRRYRRADLVAYLEGRKSA